MIGSLGALGYVVKAHVGRDLSAAGEAVILGKQFVGVRIVSFCSSIAHPTYPLSTLHCVPRGGSARLEAERIATPFS